MASATLGYGGGPGTYGGFCRSLLREVQGRRVRCYFESAKVLKGARARRGPLGVTQMQTRADLRKDRRWTRLGRGR